MCLRKVLMAWPGLVITFGLHNKSLWYRIQLMFMEAATCRGPPWTTLSWRTPKLQQSLEWTGDELVGFIIYWTNNCWKMTQRLPTDYYNSIRRAGWVLVGMEGRVTHTSSTQGSRVRIPSAHPLFGRHLLFLFCFYSILSLAWERKVAAQCCYLLLSVSCSTHLPGTIEEEHGEGSLDLDFACSSHLHQVCKYPRLTALSSLVIWKFQSPDLSTNNRPGPCWAKGHLNLSSHSSAGVPHVIFLWPTLSFLFMLFRKFRLLLSPCFSVMAF